MGTKAYKPTTPSRRGMVVSDFKELTRRTSEKSLTVGKRSTGGGYTALDREGRLMRQKEARTTAPSVIIFEGFFDFLSWIADKRPEGIPGDADVVVLNSVANAPAAMPQITDHRTVIAMLDNDAAGDSATALLHEAADAAGCRFIDARRLFAGYGDYNEKRQAECHTAKAG